MKSLIVVIGMLLVIGMGMAEDFLQGEAKGADSPGAMIVGGNQSPEVLALWNGTPIQLSGRGAKIFDTAFFKMDGWAFDATSYGINPSQAAVLKNNINDGKPLVKAKKAAYVGAPSAGDDPREV